VKDSQTRSFALVVNSLFGSRLRVYGLTPREESVTELVLRGLSNKEIAANCGISEYTVKDHLKHIYEKTGVHQRTALMALLLRTTDNPW
jgi:DNA-binding NarL/FixJ family response regulator